MGFLRKIAGFLGFAKDDVHESKGESDDDNDVQARRTRNYRETGIPRKGFGVKVEVPVDRPHLGPVISPSLSGDGGVQVFLLSIFSLILAGSNGWILGLLNWSL